MSTQTTNLGVKPLGGKTSLGISSPQVLAEIAALKTLGEDLRAAGPVNSPEASKRHRTAGMKHALATNKDHATRMAEIFQSLGLEW